MSQKLKLNNLKENMYQYHASIKANSQIIVHN